MTFVPQRRPSPRMGAIQYRDPIIGRSRTRGAKRSLSGLGASSASTQVAEGTTAVTAGATAISLIGAGAAAGSVVPVLGTAIGAVVGLALSFLGGNKEAGGVNNPTYLAIAQKWYNWYFPDWAAMNAGSSVTLQSGYVWWTGQMQADGIPNAWQNFSQSAQPVADNVAQRAAAYQALGFGGPTDPPPAGTNPLVAPPLTQPYSTYVATSGQPIAPSVVTPTPAQILSSAGATPAQIAALTPAQQATAAAQLAPAQASILGGLSGNTLLIVGGGLLFGLLLMNRRPSRTGEVA